MCHYVEPCRWPRPAKQPSDRRSRKPEEPDGRFHCVVAGKMFSSVGVLNDLGRVKFSHPFGVTIPTLFGGSALLWNTYSRNLALDLPT